MKTLFNTRNHSSSSAARQRGRRLPRGLRLLPAVLLLFGSVSLFAAPQGGAAENRSRVSGKVLDRSGAVLPRVLVQARDSQGKLVASEQSNFRGEFSLELEKGRYLITAALAGFVPLEGQPVDVTAAAAPLRLTLDIPEVREQIIVTAMKTEAPVSQVGSSSTILTGESLAGEGIASVAEALRKVAGLTVVQSGGAGKLTSLFVRGGESKYTKVLIDGIAVNEPGGSYNFANLSTSDIDRIEVVRGPQSALFGSDAIAGVIQIFTRRGTSEGLSPRPRVLVEAGTFSTFRFGGGVEGKGDRLDYAASFTRTDTDNDVTNGSFNEETLAGNLGIAPSRNSEIRFVFRSETGRSGVPGSWAFQRPEADEFYRHRDLAAGITFSHQATGSLRQKLSYTVSDSRQFSEDPSDSGSYTPSFGGRSSPFPYSDYPYQTLNQTRRQKVNYQGDLILPRGHLLTVGADYERESGVVGDPRFNPLEAVRDNFGAYVQDQWSLGNRLFAAAGVRLEHNDSFGNFAAPRLSLALHLHQPSPGSAWGLTKLKSNFGLGIKEPTLVESFSTSPYFRGNPDLRPEKSVSFDAGLEQHFRSGRGILELSYFENRFRDQVGFAITDFNTFEGAFFNIGKTRARGLEAILRQDLGRGWEVGGAYTFLDSLVLESSNSFDPAFAKGEELFRRPRHSGFIDLRWKPGRWTLGVGGIFVGNRVDSDFSGLGFTRNRGYGLLNLIASFRLSDRISCFAVVNNALDEDYMEVLGYPGLRAHFRVGLRAGF